jgi:Flp pilus assembly protein TadD
MDYIGKALALRPGDPYFLNNRGYVLLMMGRLPEALEDIDKSIVGDPRNAWAYRNKGIYYYKSGDYANAVRLLERAIELDSTVRDAKRFLELAREKKG